LADECDKVRTAVQGTRNDQLNRSACKLGGLVAAGAIDEHTVTEHLGAADGGGDYPATRKTIASGLAAGMRQARAIPDRYPIDPDPFAASDAGSGWNAPTGTASAGTTSPTLPPVVNLRDFLAQPDPEITYRIDGLMTIGARVLLAAQHKAGKTTLVGNFLRSLVDNEPFLDTHTVKRAGRIILIDDELDPSMLRRWLRGHGIQHDDRIDLVSLKGSVSMFNILEPAGRGAWAKHLGPADIAVFDCLRPVLDGLGLSEDKDAGRFLVAFDALLKEAGIGEAVIVHHMGHSGERSRGDSRLLDWPDALWKLVLKRDRDGTANHDGPRFFAAYGRDVNVPERQLGYDPDSRRLTVSGGGRQSSKIDTALSLVLEYLASESDARNGKAVVDWNDSQGRPVSRDMITKALKEGVKRGDILTGVGERNNETLHFVNPSRLRVSAGLRAVSGTGGANPLAA
jgi:hypothetical protein